VTGANNDQDSGDRAAIVAVGQGTHTIAYSIDGSTFTGLGTLYLSTAGRGVVYSPEQGLWVAVGTGGSDTVYYSPNGITWIDAAITSLQDGAYCVMWSSNQLLFLAGGAPNGNDENVAISIDGRHWVGIETPITGIVYGVAFSVAQQRWIAVGANSMAYASFPAGTWTAATGAGSSPNYGTCFSQPLGLYLTVGQRTGGSPRTISTSTNGMTWTSLGQLVFTGGSGRGNGCEYDNGTFVLVGSGASSPHYFATSLDGVAFTPRGTSPFTTAAYSIFYSRYLVRWLACGEGGANFAQSTTNGVTWTSFGGTVFTTRCNDMSGYVRLSQVNTKRSVLEEEQIKRAAAQRISDYVRTRKMRKSVARHSQK
jgi:hypothetical protein